MTRERLGVNDPDVVIRAFPELFADASSTGPDPKQLEQDGRAAQPAEAHTS